MLTLDASVKSHQADSHRLGGDVPLLGQSVDWLSEGLRLQLEVDRKWSTDCQTGALDPTRTSGANFAVMQYTSLNSETW
jgi:hypothetical protein